MKRCEKCNAEMTDMQRLCDECGWEPLRPVECINGVVPLEADLWAQLETGGGDGTNILQWIQQLETASEDEIASVIASIDCWGYLDHQQTVYDGSFAAVPHLVRIAARLRPGSSARHDLLMLVGAIAGDGNVSLAEAPRADWRARFMPSCIQSLKDALSLIYESLASMPSQEIAQSLIAASAAICGYTELWTLLANSGVECPACGAYIVLPLDT